MHTWQSEYTDYSKSSSSPYNAKLIEKIDWKILLSVSKWGKWKKLIATSIISHIWMGPRYISITWLAPKVSLGMSNHLHLHDRFTTLIVMKLYAQNQLYNSINSWDIKVLIPSLDMPGVPWHRSCKALSSICSFNTYVPQCKNSTLYLL